MANKVHISNITYVFSEKKLFTSSWFIFAACKFIFMDKRSILFANWCSQIWNSQHRFDEVLLSIMYSTASNKTILEGRDRGTLTLFYVYMFYASTYLNYYFPCNRFLLRVFFELKLSFLFCLFFLGFKTHKLTFFIQNSWSGTYFFNRPSGIGKTALNH